MKKIQIAGLVLGILAFGAMLYVPEVFASSFFSSRTKSDLNITREQFEVEESYFSSPDNKTVDDICSDLGITIYFEDKVKIFPDPVLGIGSKIEIKRAPILFINDGGTKWVARTWAETILEYFEEKGISLGPNDRIFPDPQTLIKSGMRVDVTRVEKSTEKVEEIIYFKTRYRNDNTLEKGKTKTTRAGENGLKEIIYEYTLENGQQVDKRVLEEHIVKSPVDKIVARGTKESYQFLGSGDATYYASSGVTCAFRGYKGRYLRVTNPANNKSIIVKVIGWGPEPWAAYIDLSPTAFSQLAPLWQGRIKNVKVELVK